MGDLSNVKVGDTLVINRGFTGTSLIKVDRLTKTMVICGNTRFGYDGFSKDGGSYHRLHARIPTEKDYMEVRIRKAKSKLELFKVTEDNIEAVEAFLQ